MLSVAIKNSIRYDKEQLSLLTAVDLIIMT